MIFFPLFFFPTRESRIILFNEKYFYKTGERGRLFLFHSLFLSLSLAKQSSTKVYGKTCGFARRAKRQFAAAFRLQSLTFPINSPSRENLYLTRLVPTHTHTHRVIRRLYAHEQTHRVRGESGEGEKIYILATRGKFTSHGVVR